MATSHSSNNPFARKANQATSQTNANSQPNNSQGATSPQLGPSSATSSNFNSQAWNKQRLRQYFSESKPQSNLSYKDLTHNNSASGSDNNSTNNSPNNSQAPNSPKNNSSSSNLPDTSPQTGTTTREQSQSLDSTQTDTESAQPPDPYESYKFHSEENPVDKAYQQEKKKRQQQRKKSRRASSRKKTPLALRVSVTFLAIILVLPMVAIYPLGNQTVLAKVLDQAGQHEWAMGVDQMQIRLTQAINSNEDNSPANSNQGNGQFLRDFRKISLNNPESCGVMWETAKTTNVKQFSGLEGENIITVSPSKSQYKEDFYFQSYNWGNADLNQRQLAFRTDNDVNIDTDKWAELSKQFNGDDPKGRGNLKIDADLEMESNFQRTYLGLQKLGAVSENFDGQLRLRGITETDLNEPARQALGNIFDQVIRMMDTTPQQFLEEKTGKSLFTALCHTVESYEVQAPQEKTFGLPEKGGGQVTKQVRPIAIKYKSEWSDADYRAVGQAIHNVLTDSKLKQYVKDQYPQVKKIAEEGKTFMAEAQKSQTVKSLNPEAQVSSLERNLAKEFQRQQEIVLSSLGEEDVEKKAKIQLTQNGFTPSQEELDDIDDYSTTQNQESSELTRENYEQFVESLFDTYDSSPTRIAINLRESDDEPQDNFKVNTEPTQTFINMETGDVFGSENKMQLVPKQEYVRETKQDSKVLAEIMRGGVDFKTQNYNQKYQGEVSEVEVRKTLE